jgi:hypothetical protein
MKTPKNEMPCKTEDEAARAESQIVELSKRIEFYLTEYSVELLANKMSNGEFVSRFTSANSHGSTSASLASSNR